MNLSCSSRMIKYLMFAFNLFFVLSGIIIIAVGATVKTVYTEYADFLNSKYFSLPNMLIATGALIFFISFFGCCGAIRESWIMLGIFSILLCIIFIFEFSAGIAGYVLKGKTLDYLDKELKQNLQTYVASSHGLWDTIQTDFKCCGVDTYEDWKGIFADPYELPMSCCPTVAGSVGVFYCNTYITTTTVSTSSDASFPQTTTTEGTTATITSSPATSSSSISTTTPTATTVPTPITSTTTPEITTTKAPTTPTNSTTPSTPETSSHDGSRRRRALNGDSTTEEKEKTTTPLAPSPNAQSSSHPYTTGCKTAFGAYIKKHAVQIGGCAIGLAIIQILGIAFSCHLVRQLKNGYYST